MSNPSPNPISSSLLLDEQQVIERIFTHIDNGSYIARQSAGTPLMVVRGKGGQVRAFINACRHRGVQVASGYLFNSADSNH